MENQEKQIKKIEREMEEKLKAEFEKNFVTEITQQKFRNKTTGEIVTQFSLMDINNFEKVD